MFTYVRPLAIAAWLAMSAGIIHGQGAGYWHTSGNKLFDSNNVQVRIAGVTLTSESYNGSIAPGATVSGIGFNASYSGTNSVPTTFMLNGTRCQ